MKRERKATRRPRYTRVAVRSCVVEEPAHAEKNNMHENREISSAPSAFSEGRCVKAHSRTTDMHVLEKSDCAVVCAEQRIVQEG